MSRHSPLFRSLPVRATLAALALALSVPALAHRAWLLPSDTVLAGEDAWITVDAAVSNDLFDFNHVPLALDRLAIVAPDGSSVQAQNGHTGRFRSVFDLPLTQEGTYRIAMASSVLSATWQQDGERRRWRGTAEAFATGVPKDAQALEVSQSVSRVETFATRGAPDTAALKPTGVGLELQPVTHPNDLFAGETARFAMLLDGKPAPGLDLVVVPGGSRYRNSTGEMRVRTDAEGRFDVTWPQAGMYWLQASVQDDKASMAPATRRRVAYVATLEVLPE